MLRIALVELPGFISHSNWPFSRRHRILQAWRPSVGTGDNCLGSGSFPRCTFFKRHCHRYIASLLLSHKF